MANNNSFSLEEHYAPLRAKKSVLMNSLGSIIDGFGTLTVNNTAVATFNSSATTLTNGATVGLQVDSTGSLWVTKSTLDAGEDLTANRTMIEFRTTPKSLNSCSTVLARTGTGVFLGFTIGMPSCPTITFYDALVPTPTAPLFRIGAGYPMGSHPLHISLNTGLTADASSGGVVPSLLMSVRE